MGACVCASTEHEFEHSNRRCLGHRGKSWDSRRSLFRWTDRRRCQHKESDQARPTWSGEQPHMSEFQNAIQCLGIDIYHQMNIQKFTSMSMPSVLWRCWLGGRKGIRPVKQSGGVLAWLSVWSEVQTCIWPSWCHCHSLSPASVKSRLVLPLWYRLTWVVPEKGPLNVCVCVCQCQW